jgi:hypothetical protein
MLKWMSETKVEWIQIYTFGSIGLSPGCVTTLPPRKPKVSGGRTMTSVGQDLGDIGEISPLDW